MSNNRMGKLIGVSMGPGDPGLITRRAWEVLHQDLHWAYPVRRKGADSYALDIAVRAGLAPPAHTPLVFPMTHDTAILAKYWLRAAETVLEILRTGQDLAFLVEGDASTYSTFNHLARSVAALEETAVVEIIAGVTSFQAAAACVGMPIADADETVAIIPAAYGVAMVERLLADFDTLVLLKVKPLLDELIDLLQQHGLLAHSRFIEKVGTPQERVIHDVAVLRGEKVNYLSLLLVRNTERARGALVRGCRKQASTEAETA